MGTSISWMAPAGALALVGCDPALPLSHLPGDGQGGSGGGSLLVTTEPAAPLEAAPRALRFHLEAPGLLDPSLVVLVRGTVGPVQLRDLAERSPSATLAERIVPTLAWWHDAAVMVAPTVVLDSGESYTLAVAEIRQTVAVRVATADRWPLLRRLWPPEDASGPEAVAVWCGEAPLPRFEVAATLEPDGPPGWIRRGVVAAGGGERCLRFEAREAAGGGTWVPPVVVTGTAETPLTVQLEPTPLRIGAMGTTVAALACHGDEIAFGPGCGRVEDDRVIGRSPAAPLLWAVAGAGVDSVLTTAAGDPFAISGLPPATDATLDVSAIDARGTVLRMVVTAVTPAPMPHIILNEVLANPIGPEPAQEWVEIVNDGHAPVDVGGYTLQDGGGEITLPSATLAPGVFALVVSESFDPLATADPSPAPGTLLLRVPHVGKNGLSNTGEPLALRDLHGAVVSTLPALPKPKPGQSVARRSPSSPDGAAASFALAAPSPGRRNAW